MLATRSTNYQVLNSFLFSHHSSHHTLTINSKLQSSRQSFRRFAFFVFFLKAYPQTSTHPSQSALYNPSPPTHNTEKKSIGVTHLRKSLSPASSEIYLNKRGSQIDDKFPCRGIISLPLSHRHALLYRQPTSRKRT